MSPLASAGGGARVSAPPRSAALTLALADLGKGDAALAGGKGSNLGELLRLGMRVPPGYVVTAAAFQTFLSASGLEQRVRDAVATVDVEDPSALQRTSDELRAALLAAPIPREIESAISASYEHSGSNDRAVAVRSSATAEDSAEASFAGMNESFLGVRGRTELLSAVRRCWASLYAPRVIAYRRDLGLDESKIAIAVVVQDMVDAVWAGVMLTQHPDGLKDRLLIEAAPGLGEVVVGGRVKPDRFTLDRRSLQILASERGHQDHCVVLGAKGVVESAVPTGVPPLPVSTLEELARIGLALEAHYGIGQDVEFAISRDGNLSVVQTRPITAEKGRQRASPRPAPEHQPIAGAKVLLHGLGSGFGLGSGKPVVIASYDPSAAFAEGDVLVTRMTTPDWFPLLRKAAAIVTDEGGATSHAAIVARELGIAGVVGAGNATSTLARETLVTVDGGRGLVLRGRVAPPRTEGRASAPGATFVPVTATEIWVNLSTPERAAAVAAGPVDGVGLVRAETMLLSALGGKHPELLVSEGKSEAVILALTAALHELCAPFEPRPVVYRTYDFRTNEFRELEGGERFEPVEANPMIGMRGCARYLRDRTLFALELAAVRRVRERHGCTNLAVMLPFVRNGREIRECARLLTEHGLSPHSAPVYAMAEVPSIFDELLTLRECGYHGISIGSNDMTQLLLGVDRDHEQLGKRYDARDPAVLAYLRRLILRAKEVGLHTSICGQAPSLYPEYSDFLVQAGIDAISVNQDAVVSVRRLVATAEQRLLLAAARRQTDA